MGKKHASRASERCDEAFSCAVRLYFMYGKDRRKKARFSRISHFAALRGVLRHWAKSITFAEK